MNATYAQFPKLSNTNYHVWKFNMELLLLERELWDVVVGAVPTERDAKWVIRDGKARAAIGLAVEESQKILIKQLKTAKEFWDTLKNHYEKSNITNKVSLLRQMSSKRLAGGQTMEDHITEFLSIVDRLRDLGENIEEVKAVAFLLGTLPEDYNPLISSLEMRSEADLTIDLVRDKLLQEFKRKSGCEQEGDAAFKIQRKKFVPKCFLCGKPGHFKRNCPNKTSQKQHKPNDNRANIVKDNNKNVCFGVMKDRPNGDWFIDSAATCHMCCEEKYFVNINKQFIERVYLADGSELNSSGTGNCKLFCEGKEIIVRNVLFIPELDGSLLSVRKLIGDGFDVIFNPNGCSISLDGYVHARASLKNNLFVLDHSCKANKVSNCKSDCVHVWHRRFGHRSIKAIKSTISKELVKGVNIKKCCCNLNCDVCLRAKLTRNPFPKASESKSNGILDLVHCDLCGPMQNKTPSGNRYFLTIIDDYSRYCTIFFIASKDMAFDKIKEFVEQTENQFGKRLKVLRTDRGGEFVNKRMQSYFKDKGIIHQLTAPYTPEQNGVAERKNRSLMEMARCMLYDADMNIKFWAEAVNNANYIQNRLSSAAVRVTPYELWFGKSPNLSHVHVFGAVAYVHINKQKRRKLDEVAVKCNLVGYAEETKAFRLLNTDTNKIIISRDVKFVESQNLSVNSLVDDGNSSDNMVNVPIPVLDSEKVSPQELEEEEEDNTSMTEDFYGFESVDELSSSSDSEICLSGPGYTPRTSTRTNKGVPPTKYGYKVCIEDDPVTYKEALSRSDSKEWLNAMKEEMKALQNNKTWDLVELPRGGKLIGCKWVFKTKQTVNGEKKYRARLVAKEFSQKYGENYDEIFAPVVKQTTFRSLLAIASYRKMKVRHIDVKTAFLYGELDSDIYLKQPEGFVVTGKEGLACKLKHSLYGLKQSARCWNLCINRILIDSGFRRGKAEPCLYVKGDADSITYILIYVDDIIVASKTDDEIDNVVRTLKSNFEITELGDLKLYLGIEVSLKNGLFYLSQENYIEKILNAFNLEDAKISSIPMDPGYLKENSHNLLENNNLYRKAIGSLLYVSNNTRPDIAVAVSILSRKISNPNDNDWTEVKRVLKYLKGTKNLKLCVGTKSNIELKGFADADWAGDTNDRKSTSGFIFKLGDAVISYASRKQTNVTLSSTEAEFVALAEASQELLWIIQLMKEFEIDLISPTIYEDNQSCLKILEDEKICPRSKHIDVKYYFIRDLWKSKAVLYEYCPTDSMLADILTKPLQKIKICNFIKLIGLY